MVNFQKYLYVYGVGTLNLSQEMSDKMKNKSGQFNYIELRKRQKCGQNWPFLLFFWHYGRLLWTEWTYWNESFKILSGIFWHKFRVPTRGSLAQNGPYRLKNGPKRPKMAENGQFLKILACMWCGYSKPVPGDVWQDAKWIRTITLHCTEKTSKIWSKLTIFCFFFWPFGRLLWSKWTHWHESYKILSGIFWHKFRVSTRGWLASNGPYSLKNGPKRPRNGPKWSISKNTRMYVVWVL